MMKYLIGYLLEHCQPEMNFFNQFIDKELFGRLEGILQSKFERISYTEAIAMLEKSDKQFVYPVQWGGDLQTRRHERYLTEGGVSKTRFCYGLSERYQGFLYANKMMTEKPWQQWIYWCQVGEIIGGSQKNAIVNLWRPCKITA